MVSCNELLWLYALERLEFFICHWCGECQLRALERRSGVEFSSFPSFQIVTFYPLTFYLIPSAIFPVCEKYSCLTTLAWDSRKKIISACFVEKKNCHFLIVKDRCQPLTLRDVIRHVTILCYVSAGWCILDWWALGLSGLWTASCGCKSYKTVSIKTYLLTPGSR